LTQPVTAPKKAANALGWAVKEMERRYDVLVEAGFRDISGFNAAYDRGELNSGDNTAAIAKALLTLKRPIRCVRTMPLPCGVRSWKLLPCCVVRMSAATSD
jgi:DNA segregation ATPase FtsK/SpoIIIE-like protein